MLYVLPSQKFMIPSHLPILPAQCINKTLDLLKPIPFDFFVKGKILGTQFATASYDGHLRFFDYSQNSVLDSSVHQIPAIYHELTARLMRISLSSKGPRASTAASLHLHTSQPSSIIMDASGSHLLISSWDGLIGVWDASTPDDQQHQSHTASVLSSCGFDSTVRTWDVEIGVCNNTIVSCLCIV
ncbi:hypothetical protein DFH29DRAFT_982406 [Suillus ampliporus]|nr:hypothetical protein DFH29DRAFT_982406 [Suillus ampliporus]